MLCPYILSCGPVDSRQGNVRGLIKIDSAVTGKMIWGRITLTLTLTIDGRREVRVEDGKRRTVVVNVDFREIIVTHSRRDTTPLRRGIVGRT